MRIEKFKMLMRLLGVSGLWNLGLKHMWKLGGKRQGNSLIVEV